MSDLIRREDALKALSGLSNNTDRDYCNRAIRALPAVQPDAHVNETPKSEHVPGDVLTPATKGDWQPIETAPKNGTVYIGRSLDPKRPFGPRRMRWGVAARPDEGYVGNDGKPWFINEDGRHLAPRPTHWTPATKGAAHD